MKIMLVHNPKAGYQQPTKEELMKILSGSGVEVFYVSSKDDAFTQTLLSSMSDIVVVAGGDGTIKKVARLLLGKHIPIAVLPVGTANNIAKTLGNPIPMVSTNERWLNLPTKDYDAGMVKIYGRKEYFFESAGFGVVPEMMYRFTECKQKEQLEFENQDDEVKHGQAFMKDILSDFAASHYDITIDGEHHHGRYLLVEIMNIKSVGPRLLLAPDADTGDSWLDIVLIKESEREEFFHYVSSLLNDEKLTAKFTIKKGKKISIASTGDSRLHVDDELLPDGKYVSSNQAVNLEIEIQAKSLSFFENTFKL